MLAHEGFVVNILCHRCQELLAQLCVVDVDNNTQCKKKLVHIHMRGLTLTYDIVAAAVLSPSPLRVGQYKITKLMHLHTIGLCE